MKKSIFILLIFSLLAFNTKKDQYFNDIYIFVDSENFLGGLSGSYQAYFSLISSDSRFHHDNYYFDILAEDLFEKPTLYSLGKTVDLNKIKVIYPKMYYSKNNSCEVHEELSFLSNERKRIFIVTKLPLDRIKKGGKEFMIWPVLYAGTRKDIVHTTMGRSVISIKK